MCVCVCFVFFFFFFGYCLKQTLGVHGVGVGKLGPPTLRETHARSCPSLYSEPTTRDQTTKPRHLGGKKKGARGGGGGGLGAWGRLCVFFIGLRGFKLNLRDLLSGETLCRFPCSKCGGLCISRKNHHPAQRGFTLQPKSHG